MDELNYIKELSSTFFASCCHMDEQEEVHELYDQAMALAVTGDFIMAGETLTEVIAIMEIVVQEIERSDEDDADYELMLMDRES